MQRDIREYEKETFDQNNVSGQKLLDSQFSHCTFTGCNFHETEMTNCTFSHCRFSNCLLTFTKLRGVSLNQTTFADCKMVGLEFNPDSLSGLLSVFHLERCRVLSCHFSGLEISKGLSCRENSIQETHFHNCRIPNTDFSLSDFTDCSFQGCDLCGSDFSHCRGLAMDPRENSLQGAKFSLDGAMNLLANFGIEIN